MNYNGIAFDTIIGHYFYAFVRISSIFVAAPIWGSKLIPIRVRVIAALLITFIILPMVPSGNYIDPMSLLGGLTTISQILLGITIGLVFQFIFQIVVLGGQILAMQCGLGFATLVDPQNHETLPMVSQFYMMSVTLLFLAFNGHIILLQMLVNSFETIPIGPIALSTSNLYDVITFTGNIFSGAVSIALPAIIALLSANLTFAVMTKSAPQLNIFTIGFPLTLLFGLSIIFISYDDMLNQAKEFFEDGFMVVKQVIDVK